MLLSFQNRGREEKEKEKEVHTEKVVKKIPEDFEDVQSMVTDSCEIQWITDWWLHYSEEEFLI